MKIRHSHSATLAMGLVVILFMLLCNVELTIAQDQNKDAVNGASPDKERLNMWRDIFVGKIYKPIGAKDYVPPKNPELLPRPTPPVEQDRLIFGQNENLDLRIEGIAAGYQCFEGGCVYGQTNSVTNLYPNAVEYQVIHQWPTSGENCIVITYHPNDYYAAVFGIFISALGGYQDYAYFQAASDTFTLAIQPEYSSGSTSYSEITFYVYDDSTSTLWSETYSLGTTQYIKDVDYALEQDNEHQPNGLSCSVTGFFALDKDFNFVDLQSCFSWTEWESLMMVNVHWQTYYDDGYSATLTQAKWWWL
jgi:hypothetical protein